MSFYSKEQSFFLDAVASTTFPVVQIVPLTDIDVFNYLDAHPGALQEYFKERKGYASSFVEIPVQDLTAQENVPANDSNTAGPSIQQLRSLFDEVDEEADRFAESLFADAHALFEESLFQEARAIFAEEAGPEKDESEDEPEDEPEDDAEYAQSEYDEESNFSESELASRPLEENFVPSLFPSAPLSSSHPALHRPISLSPSLPSPTLAPTPSPPPSPSPSPPPPPPPPQPAVPTSLPPKNSRVWSAAEEDSCCKHMIAVCQEGGIQGEARFRETQRRMIEEDGFQDRGATAVKNFWNRVGRARCNLDERKNKKAPLATSQQGKPSKSARSLPAKSSQVVGKSSAQPKGRPPKQMPDTNTDSDTDPDNEQGYDSIDTTPPRYVKKLAKRDRDDDESEWEPDRGMLNAIAKGIRAPKKARVSY